MISSKQVDWIRIALAAAVILLLGGVVYFFFSSSVDKKTSDFQAVFLANGQVYFGHLTEHSGEWLALDDVYYFQARSATSTDSSADGLALTKLGTEIHGPENRMRIVRDNVLFVEDLRSDSKVVGAIRAAQ